MVENAGGGVLFENKKVRCVEIVVVVHEKVDILWTREGGLFSNVVFGGFGSSLFWVLGGFIAIFLGGGGGAGEGRGGVWFWLLDLIEERCSFFFFSFFFFQIPPILSTAFHIEWACISELISVSIALDKSNTVLLERRKIWFLFSFFLSCLSGAVVHNMKGKKQNNNRSRE